MNTTNRHPLTRFIRFILLLLAVVTLSLPMAIRYAAAEPDEPVSVSKVEQAATGDGVFIFKSGEMGTASVMEQARRNK